MRYFGLTRRFAFSFVALVAIVFSTCGFLKSDQPAAPDAKTSNAKQRNDR